MVVALAKHVKVRSRVPSGYWNETKNIHNFMKNIKIKYNLKTLNDWNSLTQGHIKAQKGGNTLLNKYSLYDLKCIGFPEGKFKKVNPIKPAGYWEIKSNVIQFLQKLKDKYNLKTPEDWNLITQKQIKSQEGIGSLLEKYSIYDLKCIGCPEGKLIFKKSKKSKGFWEEKDNILFFMNEIKNKYNLNSNEDWNLITRKHIKSNGGASLLSKYSLFELKKLIIQPEEQKNFNNNENLKEFIDEIRCKYNLNDFKDWNLITHKKIRSSKTGKEFLKKYSIYELKCLGFPDGKFKFNKPPKYWDKNENINQFLSDLRENFNLHSFECWNDLSEDQICSIGGKGLLNKYSLYEIKCLGFPDGKFNIPSSNPIKGYWEDKNNILLFLNKVKEKFNVNTPEDWNLISQKNIISCGGSRILSKYSMYELKCLACPDGKLLFDKPNQFSRYWDDKQNIKEFLNKIQEKYNFKTPEDWNLITRKQIQSNGGSSILKKYSMFELKVLACPEGKSIFNEPEPSKSSLFWDNENNRTDFINKLKRKYNLNTPQDWKRLSTDQIRSQGGHWLFYDNNKYLKKCNIKFEINDKENGSKDVLFSLKDLIDSNHKRSAQRWLFLQVQKLFPNEEIVEDYFHSQISRESGYSIQFDIFLIKRKIAIEYHGKQHYEDIPEGFAPLEMHKVRDLEKETLCKNYGIQLFIIPYWWDNKLDSLKETLGQSINFDEV